jgi:CubicO group peptidase (beta-lactamase class C family)
MSRARLVCLALSATIAGCATPAAQTNLAARVDAIVQPPITGGKLAGASIAVVQRGQTLLIKEYGFADLELDVPTPAKATYEIGSVTKQFTAAAILLLAEQGKLSLDDDITKHLTDYPTRGQTVTIRRLLNHTSGIKGYTEMREFGDFQRMHRPRQELVTIFSGAPFEFAPGTEQTYNNSAFFLLGLIIEKLSGTSYESFVKTNLFDSVGMPDSYYCSEKTIRKNHAHGYDTDGGQLVLKAYLDHLWPFSAGSLCSNATDLVAWTRALHGGKVLKPESYREMTTPGTLNDGTKIRYGLGIGLADIAGRRAIAHGGGIHGFLSEVEYYPDDDLVIVVLLNTAGPVAPRDVARQIADAVLPAPKTRSQTFSGDLAAYAGTYTGHGRGRDSKVRIAVENGALTFADLGAARPTEKLSFYGNDTFGFRDVLVIFERSGRAVARLRVDTGSGHNILAREGPGTAPR